MLQSPFEPCIPTPANRGARLQNWLHEIKHDGYRLIVQREGKRVRLFTRNGHDWSEPVSPDHGGRAADNRNTSL